MLRSAGLAHGKQIHLIEENLQRSDQKGALDSRSKTIFLTNSMGHIRIHCVHFHQVSGIERMDSCRQP